MGKLTKNQKLALEKIEAGKIYTLKEAAEKIKEITFTKFDASFDIDVRLGVDPRKWCAALFLFLTEQASRYAYWFCAPQRQIKLPQKKLEQTT